MAPDIPIQLTRFIGRERQVGAVKSLLAGTHLLTLTGPGGSGKTRLAIEVARQLAEAEEEALFWVDLAPISDASLLPRAVGRVLGLPEEQGQPATAALVDFLAGRRLLLILDNCEHVVAACAELVHLLLHRCPGVHILTTSREQLAVAGERVYPVPPLSVPPATVFAELGAAETVSAELLEQLGTYEAISLFLDRAAAVVPDFALTADNAPAVATICSRLDGLPLAIELAAARVSVLTAEQIASRLDERFTLLKSSLRGERIDRHQTLRSAIDWSYGLLTPAEQTIFRRLSLFAGGCSLATAEAICTGDAVDGEQLLTLFSSLVDKSLVVAETLRPGDARYTMLETIRQYADEKLEDAGEKPAIRDRHLQCFLELVEETEPKLQGEFQQLWLNWLESEVGNIRAALSWSLESGQFELGLRIAIAIYEFWTIRDYTGEALAWLEQLLVRADEAVPLIVRAKALSYATFLAGFRGNSAAQAAYGREAADVAAALGAEGQSALAWARAGEAYTHGRPGPLPSGGSALAWALGAQAYSARAEGDYESELALYKRVIQLHREAGRRYFLGVSLITASFAAQSLAKYEEARAMVDEALPLLRTAGNSYSIAMTLNGSGDLARCQGDYGRAQADYEESIALLRQIGAVRDLASALHNLGYTSLHLGNVERAHALFTESMALQQAQQNMPGMAECLMGFSAMAVIVGLPVAGARLLAAAVAIGGEQVATTWAATKMEYEYYLALTRSQLTEQAFQGEQMVGRALSVEQAMAYAQNLPLQAATPENRKEPSVLTPREREVATLVAQAKSNDEIAEELTLSKRTVEKHISNIRSKLGFTERAQMVRWAVESGLVDLTE